MKLLLFISLNLIFLLSTHGLKAQTTSSQSVDLTQLVDSKILEVYGQPYMTNNPELLPVFRQFLIERVSYKTALMSDNEKYPKLSSYGLRNKNNASLTTDMQFNPELFNALKYNIPVFEQNTQIIRFDNSDILIIVKPVNYPNNSNR